MSEGIIIAGGRDAAKVDGLTVDVKIVVTKRNITYQICAAVEGGIGYWCPRQEFKYKKPKNPVAIMDGGEKDGQIWPCYDYPVQEGGAVTFFADDDAPVKKCVLNLKTIKKGLDLMAKNSPRHFADLINENGDATTGDVFVQYCVFGELVYG